MFTLPHELNSLILGNRKVLFTLFFDSAKDTLLTFGKDKKYLGGTIGINSILHTWGQDLSFHPHVHCIVSGGGISDDGKWMNPRRETNTFLFPIQAMKTVYRAIFMKRLRKYIQQNLLAVPDEIVNVLKSIADKTWNVYAKAPFTDVSSVVEYLGRYSHKIAITHHRIKEVSSGIVVFQYKDYADSNKKKVMVIPHDEFLRRMELHILPKRYVKIRHYGYAQNKGKHKRLDGIRSQLKLNE